MQVNQCSVSVAIELLDRTPSNANSHSVGYSRLIISPVLVKASFALRCEQSDDDADIGVTGPERVYRHNAAHTSQHAPWLRGNYPSEEGRVTVELQLDGDLK
jgi:hypothetical protein